MSQPATDPPTLPPPHMLTSTLPMETILLVSNTLFESSRAIQGIAGDILLNNSPFSSYDDFIAAIETQLLCLFVSGSGLPPIDETGRANIEESFTDIMAAHPRLGGKRVDSALSRAEQAQLQSQGRDDGGAAEEQARELARLNEAYEQKFPGLRYVVFVNGRGRDVIMADMRMRIERGDLMREKEEGLKAMCDIARDRASKLPIA